VLAAAFAPEELEGAAKMADGLREGADPRALVTVAQGQHGNVLGGIVGELYERERVLLLAYLAVRPALRGRGIGAALVRHAAAQWFAGPSVHLVLAEVHDPRRWSAGAREEPVARLRLFARLGARVLGVPFVQPALEPGGARSGGFLLLAFHVDPSVDAGGAVRAEVVSAFVRRYYATAEGASEPYDRELARLLEAIDERPAIPLLPVSGYEGVPLLPPCEA
jgi:GNAT superfamily N-acetyltransferase